MNPVIYLKGGDVSPLAFFNALMRLRIDMRHDGLEFDREIISEQHIRYKYKLGGVDQTDIIWRGLHKFWVFDGRNTYRIPQWNITCWDTESGNDFRLRRFSSYVLAYYEFATPELDYKNVVRYGSRFAAYDYRSDTENLHVVAAIGSAAAFGDTAEEAYTEYLERKQRSHHRSVRAFDRMEC